MLCTPRGQCQKCMDQQLRAVRAGSDDNIYFRGFHVCDQGYAKLAETSVMENKENIN